MDMCFVGDVVENNGRTIKENNMAIVHDIPLGTLVEVRSADSDFNGIRLFVVEHERDCDGEPLYTLSFNKGVVGEIHKVESEKDDEFVMLTNLMIDRLQGSVLRGWTKESLVIIG